MTDAVAAKIAEWEALVEAATRGPWTFEPAGDFECGEPGCCHEYWDNRIWGDRAVLVEGHMLTDEDARFIAAARTAMPALLGFVREVRAALAHELCADTCGSQLNEVYPCSCWKSEIERALTKWIGGEG